MGRRGSQALSVSTEPVAISLPNGRTAFSQVARGLWGMRLHYVLYDPELDSDHTVSRSSSLEATPTRPVLTVMESLSQPKPTVVFIHGFQSDWQAWTGVLPGLGEGCRTIALDLPGHGRSAKPLTTYTIPFYARAVASFLLYLRNLCRPDPGATPAPSPGLSLTLVGVSLGGAIAVRTALTYPSLVQRLVLVDAAGIGPRSQPLASRGRFVPMLFWQVLGRPRAATIRHAYESSLMHRHDAVTPSLVNDTIATQRACRLASLLTGITLSLPSARAYAELPQVSQPTLLVWGRHDRVFPVSDAQAAQARIPRAKLVVCEDCGHVPMQEKPEALAKVLRQFIAAEPGLVD